MEEPIKIVELLALALFLGSLSYGLGCLYQSAVLYQSRTLFRQPWRAFGLLLGTRLVTIFLTLIGWLYWPLFPHLDIMWGPFLLPALLSETVVAPLVLKATGYRVLPAGS